MRLSTIPRALAALLCLPLVAQQTPKAHFYFATYPGTIVEFDPTTDEVVRKIDLRHGMPWGVRLLHDHKRFTVVTDQQRKIEVIDLEAGAVVEEHDFAEEGMIIRIRSAMEIDVRDC